MQQEVGVFEPAEQREVAGDAGGQPAPCGGVAAGAGAAQDVLAEQVVRGDGAKQQQDEARVPPAVEEQAGGEEPGEGPGAAGETAEQEAARQAGRQEAQHETLRMEQHGARRRVSARTG